MRKILFRGMTLKQSPKGIRWVFGDLSQDNESGYVSIIYYDDEDGWMEEYVDEKTVGQFTGFFDAKDQPIIEGDILKNDCIKDREIQSVRYNLGGFELQTKKDFALFKNGVPIRRYIKDDTLVSNGFSIIGNIHENPELLEGGEK